jgi:hypothetical protein
MTTLLIGGILLLKLFSVIAVPLAIILIILFIFGD